MNHEPVSLRLLRRSSRIVAPLILILAIGCLAYAPRRAAAFCNENVLVGACPGAAGGHTDITAGGLGFLRRTVLDDIVDEHVFVDTVGAASPQFHFDNSQFTQSVGAINAQYTMAGGVVAELNPAAARVFEVTDKFGQLLHTAQDFYSHTNWVDYDPTSVPRFDEELGTWTVPTPYGKVNRGAKELIVIEGVTPPAPITSFTIRATANGVNRLVDVNKGPLGTPEKIGDGLVSGSFGLGVMSPPGATIPHGSTAASDDATSMNKDNNTRTNHLAAFNAAVKQTEHEWCRLLHLTKTTHGQEGAAAAMALMVDPAKSPHPADCKCTAPLAGTKTVEVNVMSIKVIDDTDPGLFQPGEMNFTFVAYSKDFRRSARNEVNSISVHSGAMVPGGSLPASLTLSLDNLADLVLTLQSWDDDNLTAPFDGVLDDSDDVLHGATLHFTDMPFAAGVHKVTTTQLEVTFSIAIQPKRVPEPASLVLLAMAAAAVLPILRQPRIAP